MSGADDQRGAEVPTDVARRWLAERDEARKLLAETRDRRDYLQGQLDIIYDAEYSLNDALRSDIEKMGTAGDALADQAVDAAGRLSARGEDDMSDATLTQVHAWRSVRGDAPKQPPAAPRELPFREDDLAEGMQRAWSDVVGDVGHIPEDFTVRPRTAKVTADFLGGSFARSVLGYLQSVAAAPAVARTDGQPPADDTGWTSVCDELHLDADAPASAVVDRLRLLKSRYEQLSEAAGHEVPVDGLTAEQYRHIYTDLIRGLAVDLGLDPEKAGGGSVTAAVRRLVAGVAVPQKSTESPAGDTDAPNGMSLDRFAAMPPEQAREWIEERHAEHRRQREAECDANGRHLVLEADTSHCGHCDRLYADIAGGSAPASTDGDQ